jgi:hypothetical protein
MPFLSPIKKHRLHVEDSREDVIAVAEKKVFSPGDLLVKNGFKLSVYYTDQPCHVPNCKDPACVFGHTCKCPLHTSMGDVLKGECFSVLKKSGKQQAAYKSNFCRINVQRRAEVTSTDYFAFFKARTNSFITSSSHSWNDTPTPAESLTRCQS